MRRSSQFSGAGKRVKMRPAALALCAGLVALVGLGCNNTNRGKGSAADPLFGSAPGPTATKPGTAAAAAVPAGSMSNAALVNGATQPPPYNYNPYAQPGANPTGQPTSWQTPPGQPNPAPAGHFGQPNYAPPGQPPYQPNQPAPGQPSYQPYQPAPGQPGQPSYQPYQPTAVPVGQPPYSPPGQPAPPQPNQPYQPAPVTSGYMPGQRVLSYDQAQTYIATLGVKFQRLEEGDGEWKFACSIPRRDNPAISRTYEGRATTYLAAVQAVLDQINQDRP